MQLLTTLTNINNIDKLAENGITGIICGIQDFSTRFNSYYDLEAIKNIQNKCQQSHLKLYLSINRMIFEDDLKALDQLMQKLSQLDVDGIFFNDMAVLSFAQKYAIENLLIYNPDTLLTNYLDINTYLDFGLLGCQLAHEITIDEDLEIISKCPNKLAKIIHGRQVMSYSHRKFIENYLQHLNLKHDIDNNYKLTLLEQTRDYLIPVLENQYGTTIFTDYTLCSYKEYQALKDAGLAYAIIDDIFMNDDELFDSIRGYVALDSNYFDYMDNQYPNKYYGSGYYYQKTNLVK